MATEPARTVPDRRPPLRLVGGEALPAQSAPTAPGRLPAAGSRARTASGPDRITVILFSLAAVLVVLTLLARQLTASASAPAQRQVLVRKVYRTTIVTTVPGAGAASVSQSVSSSGGSYSTAPATTRSSSAP